MQRVIKTRQEINEFWRDYLLQNKDDMTRADIPNVKVIPNGTLVRVLVGKYEGKKARVCSSYNKTGLHWVRLSMYKGTEYFFVDFGPYDINELEILREKTRGGRFSDIKTKARGRFSYLR